VYAALREKEKAFEALNKAYEKHDIPLSATGYWRETASRI